MPVPLTIQTDSITFPSLPNHIHPSLTLNPQRQLSKIIKILFYFIFFPFFGLPKLPKTSSKQAAKVYSDVELSKSLGKALASYWYWVVTFCLPNPPLRSHHIKKFLNRKPECKTSNQTSIPTSKTTSFPNTQIPLHQPQNMYKSIWFVHVSFFNVPCSLPLSPHLELE